ncbi:type II toxin-antitoxin system VapC family toxin [Salmonella enterica subsp. enterica serovar Virchow]|nr:type II toxin-antitoxin system VapC family toxin [Salmonella enterica subsp. enterica serovar Virchow]
MFLLDTNIISETRRIRPHGGVLAWIGAQNEATLFISAVSAGEIQAGIEVTRARDNERADALEIWLEEVLAAFRILPMDAAAFRTWAKLKYGRSSAIYDDAMIAAAALRHGLTVATRNIRDFAGFGVKLVNPFDYRG